MRNKIILIQLKAGILASAILLFLLLPNFFARSQSSSDAIAIRIIPNPYHYSASRWYYGQGFAGSPQSTVVDGYQAVRDGRTVYVNVANVNAGNLFTNIYLISHNQDAQSATVDIFSKILSSWKFNTNINSTGFCRGEPDIFCLKDENCPIGDFCDSMKARIVRDVRRLADLADIEYLAENYKTQNGYYPILGAGTYLPHRTVSVWPSWKDEFSGVLGRSLPADPVNRLGPCPNYNEITCWDEYDKKFASVLPDLPDNSLAYHYMTDSKGATASYCAIFESGLNIQGALVCARDVCLDFDGDGWGSPASGDCPNSGLDCNDNDPDVQAGSPENCGDGIDNDCDGLTDCDDGDCANNASCSVIPFCGDGICSAGEDCHNCEADCGICPVTCPDGTCDQPNECPSGSSPCSADCYCGNGTVECGEECDDGNTNNGDGCSSVCENEPPCVDSDSDGHDACDATSGDPVSGCSDPCDCRDDDSGIHPGVAEICDGIDNDCDSGTPDGSGESAPPNDNQTGVCAGNQKCLGGVWQDSYQATYEIPEKSCADGLDNDCDGLTDCGDSDCAGDPACGPNCGTNGCETGENCDNCPADCGNCCGNGACDDIYGENCNTCSADCGDCCGNGACEPAYGEDCSTCPQDCGDCCADDDGDGYDACDISGLPISGCSDPCDCNDSASWINQGHVETCDGYDNDCDGDIDEGCDDDGDGYCDNSMQIYNNNSMCANTLFSGDGMWGNDCDDDNGNIHPGAAEICDGYDNDCDAGTADGSGEIPPANPLNLGVCAGTNQACVDGSWEPSYPSTYQTTEANCTDGLDNDCDGLIDCYDTDCQCNCIFTLILPCEFL